MGRRAKKPNLDEAEGDMTPFIDVVFLLLIFFILMPFKTEEAKIETNLPKDTGQSAEKADPEDMDKIDIKMKTNGQPISIFNNQGVTVKINNKLCSIPQLYPRLQSLATTMKGGLKVPVELNADEDVPFYFVMRALNAAKLNNLTNIKFAAPPTLNWGKKASRTN